MSSPKIAVYNLADLKNTTDDALPNYLTSLKFKQSHNLTDVRLLFGYAAVLIAAVTFYYDYKLGWDQTKYWTLWAVVVYFLLNGALTLWIWKAEKGNVFVGTYNKTMLSIASSVTKHTPVYNLKISCSDQDGGWKHSEISASFARWFDAEGHFIAGPFQLWLRSEVPLVGQADPRRIQDSQDVGENAPGEIKSRPVIEERGSGFAGRFAKDSAAPKSRKFKS